MRLYLFNNMYISAIQNGIQGIHVLGEMLVKYAPGTREHDTVTQWARDHKTVVILKGGYAETLEKIHDALKGIARDWVPDGSALAFAWFHEEQAAMNGCLTSVGAVVPEECYPTSADDRVREKELRAKAETLGYDDPLDAALDTQAFTAVERFQLLRGSFGLA